MHGWCLFKQSRLGAGRCVVYANLKFLAFFTACVLFPRCSPGRVLSLYRNLGVLVKQCKMYMKQSTLAQDLLSLQHSGTTISGTFWPAARNKH